MVKKIYKILTSRVNSFVRVRRLKNISYHCRKDAINQAFIPDFELGYSYPKKVFQTYHSKELPADLLASHNKFKEMNPDWEFILFDDNEIESYITKNFPSLLTFYQSINFEYGAARADFFRYLLMYKEGGIYLDIKSSFSIPLNDLVINKTGFVLSHWDNEVRGEKHFRFGMHPEISYKRGEYLQCVIVTPSGHSYLRAVIENLICQIQYYDEKIHGVGRFGVLRVTGPIMFTNAISRIKDYRKDTLCDLFKEGFIYNVLENKTHHTLFKKHYSELTLPIICLK
jgi:mannosyltransferase OCH1-like enzyme